MTTPFTSDESKPLYKQVVEWFEHNIDTGDLEAGTKLPSTDALAEELHVGRKVIQQSFEILSDRGFLERSPGRGTFIAQNVHNRTIAVLFPSDLFSLETFSFFRLVWNEVLEIIKNNNYKASLHFPTDNDDVKRCANDLRKLAEAGKIKGLISFGSNMEFDLAVPSITGTSGQAQASTRDTLVFRGLNYLITRGYKNIALLEHGTKSKPSGGVTAGIEQILKDYSDDISIFAYQGHNSDIERDGRAVTHEILSSPAGRPEALLVTDDHLARGAIFAIMEHGLKIPDDIAIIAHSNKGSVIPCPVELTTLENSPADFANQSFQSLMAKLEGRPEEPIAITQRLIIGKSCGE